MNAMEKKINACLQAIAAADEKGWQKAAEDARKILVEAGAISENESDPPTTKRIRYEIESAFIRIGVPSSLIGYEYAITATTMVVLDKKAINSITKGIYGDVAAEYDTTPSRVERAIRHLIEVAYDRGNVDEIEKIVGYACSKTGKLTNGEFISNLARHICRNVYGNK
jgi:two-component system response regulator (stage 0 sporulation protein A)